jgi:hypothetical protein
MEPKMDNQEPLGKTCPKCGARFLDGRLYWATGKSGDPKDLAGLVCQPFGDATCINPMKDAKGGDTWQKRLDFMNHFGDELDLPRVSS